MRTLEKVLNKLDGYLLSIKRNPDIGMYELEIGIPKNWVYKDTQKIKCEAYHETDDGKLIKIIPIVDGVVIDDLIDFVEAIIDVNDKINKMQEEFDKKMAKTKKILEDQVQDFYNEIDSVKENSFGSIEEEVDKAKKRNTRKKEEPKDKENFKEEVETKLSR